MEGLKTNTTFYCNGKNCIKVQKAVSFSMFILLTTSQIWALATFQIYFKALGIGFTLNYFTCLVCHYLELSLIVLLHFAIRKKSLYYMRCWYLARNAIFSLEVLVSMTHAQLYFGKLQPQPPISPAMPTTIFWIWGWWAYLVFDMICLVVHLAEFEPVETDKSWTLCQRVNIGRLVYAHLLFYFVPMLTYIYVHVYQFVIAFGKEPDDRPGTLLMSMYATKTGLLLLLFPLTFVIYQGITKRDISKVKTFYVSHYILIYPMALMVNIRSFLEGENADNSLLTFLIEMVFYFLQYQILNFLVIELFIQFKLCPFPPKWKDFEITGQGYHKLCKTILKSNQDFFNDIKISLKNLKLIDGDEAVLGEGNFGRVTKGVMLQPRGSLKLCWILPPPVCCSNRVPVKLVAVKVLTSVQDGEYDSVIMKELRILKQVGYHKHLVQFLGCCIWMEEESNLGVIGIVMEYCSFGSLADYLKILYSNHQTQVDTLELLRFSIQTAEAMVYLSEKKIVHADLATRNILLDGEKTVKLADFGMSFRLYYYQLYQKSHAQAFPWRWMAPESLTDLKFSTKTDVWTFSVVVWEIWSLGRVPFEGFAWSSDFVRQIMNGVRLEKPTLANASLYSIMLKCWELDAANRPEFQGLALLLNAMYQRPH